MTKYATKLKNDICDRLIDDVVDYKFADEVTEQDYATLLEELFLIIDNFSKSIKSVNEDSKYFSGEER